MFRVCPSGSFFRKESRTFRFWFSENAWKSMNMVLNGSAMGPHGLIFNEDGAISCPMPPDPLPTPFKTVLNPLWSIFGRKGVDNLFRRFFLYVPSLGNSRYTTRGGRYVQQLAPRTRKLRSTSRTCSKCVPNMFWMCSIMLWIHPNLSEFAGPLIEEPPGCKAFA